MFDWIIIGGGIHGCTIATYLIRSEKVKINHICIIDPNKEPLYIWKRNTNRIGMKYLRSPSVHHIDINPFSLEEYGKNFYEKKNFYGQYNRPSLKLFNEHSKNILQKINLHKVWHTAKVHDLLKKNKYWDVQTDQGTFLQGKNVVLAIGSAEQLNIPQWAQQLKRKTENVVEHIFSDKVDDLIPPIIVVGGGTTAAHTSIKLSRLFPGQVTLLKRHDFRIYDFDSDPGWLGPKNMQSFEKIEDYNERRKVIQKARHRGSIPKDLYYKLQKLKKDQKLNIANGEVSLAYCKGHEMVVNLKDHEASLIAKSIVLATGFRVSHPGWLKKFIKRYNLECAKCGYPIVNKELEWCERLYVSGPLAELEIGPVSKNISGARKAAERIVSNYKS